jgi:penicillin-binding protein 1B
LGQRYRVNTTIDKDLQHDAIEAVRVGMQEVERQLAGASGSKVNLADLQVALIAVQPHTGEIKALIGGRNYRKSQLNHATARRQPGSVFKPFVYAAR